MRLDSCCGPLLDGTRAAPTALELMRSRYVAYLQGNTHYLAATWHPRTRPSNLVLDAGQKWIGLSIRRVEQGGVDDLTGTVHFVARYKVGGKAARLEEISSFERLDGHWVYTTAEHPDSLSG